MIGYKASYDGKCKLLQYEVGKTYTFHGNILMCKRGFHFCEKPEDTLQYYKYKDNLKLFEVEALGECITEDEKTVTDKLKVIKELPLSITGIEVEHAENSTKVYFRGSGGFLACSEYNEDSNEIYFRNSNGYKKWREYDKHGNEIHFRNSDGFERWCGYDENNRLIHYRNSYGIDKWLTYDVNHEGWEYDEDGNVIYYWNLNGDEWWGEYDEDGNLIHYRDVNGDEWSIEIN